MSFEQAVLGGAVVSVAVFGSSGINLILAEIREDFYAIILSTAG